MSKIKINDLNDTSIAKMTGEDIARVTGGGYGGFGNDLLNADDVFTVESSIGSAQYATWRANYGATS